MEGQIKGGGDAVASDWSGGWRGHEGGELPKKFWSGSKASAVGSPICPEGPGP